MEGTIIGQYRIVRKIGSGGMGAVYLGEHTLVGRRAAIKVLLPEFSVRRAIVQRFFNEAKAMTAINDPGIVQMYDFGFHDGSAFMVMELLEGETLDRRRKRFRRLPLVDALRVIRQVCGSLARAHAAGVVHRDLKPDNIFMVRDPEALGGERPKVLDFGIAKLSTDPDRDQTMAGTMLGTPAYMSPEQCRGASLVDARSDIYSLGCVLTSLVTGRPPFDRHGMGELISAHINDAPAVPSVVAPELPPELDDLVLRCLAKAPEARFQSMLELQVACDALLAKLSGVDVPLPVHTPSLPSLPIDEPSISVEPIAPTTLSSAAGVTLPSAGDKPRRRHIWIGLAATVAVGAALAIVVMNGGKDVVPVERPVRAVEPPPPTPVAAPAPVVTIDAPVPATAPVVDAGIDAPKRTPARPRPPTSSSDDLYDDR